MNRGIKRKLERVTKEINRQLVAEYEGLNHFGRGMQREGFVGGYLQALSDVHAAMNGWADQNSRFGELWADPEKRA